MNKLITKIVGACLGLTMAVGAGVAIARNGNEVTRANAASPTTLTTNELSGTSGDGNISWTAIKGSSATAPAIYNSGIRLYQNGGFIQLTANNGTKITGFTAQNTGTYATTANYAVSESAFSTSSTPSNAGTNASVSKNGTYTISNLNSTYVAIICRGSDKSSRFEVSSISVTYTGGTVAVTGVSVSPTEVSIGVGGTQQLTPTISPATATDKAVTYSSNATGVATVNLTGLITAVAAGNATITVTTHDGGYTATCAVTVTAPVAVTGVTLNKNSTNIEVGGTETLTATVAPNDATNKSVNWSTSAPGVATVAGGVVTAVSVGTATITVTTVDGSFTATCSVQVKVPTSVTFTAGTDTGSSGGQYSSTISKSGISIAFSSCRNSDAPYRIYTGSTTTISSTVGDIAKIEFNMNGSYSSAEFSCTSGGGTYVSSDSTHGVWTGTSTSIEFTAASQIRCDSIVVTLASNDPLVELDASSVTSVSMMKGDTNTAVKVHVLNIASKTWTYTFDEDEEVGLNTSSYINVSAGAAVDDVHTLTITTKATGSTVLHISVSGTACTATVPVTVNQKPASMQIVHSDISEGELEIITGAHKQVSFSGEDTDGNAYAIAAGDVTPSATSGSSHVTLSGSRITGASEGDAVVRYTLNALNTVYAEVTVHVVDDYIASVGTPTYASNLSDTQGQSPTVSVFTSRPGTLYSGASTTVPFENYLFSYENSYASAQYANVFSYDFSHGSTVDSTHKSQTIYVFCDIGSTACGSYTITVEQLDDPLTAITFTNVTNNAVDVNRGDTFQLEWAYTPANPTDGKEVEFVIDDNSEGIDITVSSTGLISIGSSSDLGTALVLIQSAHDDSIYDYVYVSAVLGTMKYTINETVSWDLVSDATTLQAGDVVVITGVKNEETLAMGTYSSGNNVKAVVDSPLTISNDKVTSGITNAMIYTLVAGTSNGTIAFKDSAGKYLNACSSSNNNMHSESSVTVDSSFTIDASGNVYASGSSYTRNYMRFNPNGNNDAIFSCYTSSSTTGALVTFYKMSGGESEITVTETLFNGIHNNFGEGKTYEWDASCSSFDSSSWLSACNALKGITSYSNYKLNRAVGNMAGNEVEVFLAKYDAIIGKFGIAHDHLNRFQNGGINASQRFINPTGIIQNGNLAAVLVVLSMISLTAVGGYFFLRKKKEQ